MICLTYCDARNFWRASDENGVHCLKRIFLEGHIVRLNFVMF